MNAGRRAGVSARKSPPADGDRRRFVAAAERLLEVARALLDKASHLQRPSHPPVGQPTARRPVQPPRRPLRARTRLPRARDATDLSTIAERTIAATVQVEHGDTFGTGFLVHPSGLVVSARHVVEVNERSLRTVKVRLADERELTATVVRSHPILDFALMWLDRRGPFPTVPIGRTRDLRPAQTVLAVGHPFQFRNTVSRGIVSNPAAEAEGLAFIQTDTAVDPGNSGGPLVDARGEVVGINLWIVRGAGSAKFALPIDYVIEDIEIVLALGRSGCLERPYCRWCGSLHERATWFCPTCGAQDFERDPAPEEGESIEDKVRRRLRDESREDEDE